MIPKFAGTIKQGQVFVDKADQYKYYLSTLEGKKIEVVVKKCHNTRSYRQNAYYFSVVVRMIAEETGYSTDETHEILKGKFLAEEARVGNEIIRYVKSTAALKTNEFESLMAEIREWASVTLNLFVPLPNEVDY